MTDTSAQEQRGTQRVRRDERPYTFNIHNHIGGQPQRPIPPPPPTTIGEPPVPWSQAFFDAMPLEHIRYYGYRVYVEQSGIRAVRRLRRPALWIGRIVLLLILAQLIWFTMVFAIQNRMVEGTPTTEAILRLAEYLHPQVEEANRSALLTEVEGFLLRAERFNNSGTFSLNSFYANQDLLKIANELVDEARNPNTSAQLAREDLLSARRLAWKVLGSPPR